MIFLKIAILNSKVGLGKRVTQMVDEKIDRANSVDRTELLDKERIRMDNK